MTDFILEHWEYFLIGFYILEKLVKLTKWKWDDILLDGIKEIIRRFLGGKKIN